MVDKVAGLVHRDSVEIIFQPKIFKGAWGAVASDNPIFFDIILELKERLDSVNPILVDYPRSVASFNEHFETVEEPFAREFLGTLLAARLISSMPRSQGDKVMVLPGADEPVVLAEASAMARELGLKKGWQDPKAEQITVKQVIGAILREQLHVRSRQRQGRRR